jgi:hypothetical protein
MNWPEGSGKKQALSHKASAAYSNSRPLPVKLCASLLSFLALTSPPAFVSFVLG